MIFTEAELAAIKGNTDSSDITKGDMHILNCNDDTIAMSAAGVKATPKDALVEATRQSIEKGGDLAIISGLLLVRVVKSNGGILMMSRAFSGFMISHAGKLSEGIKQMDDVVRATIYGKNRIGHSMSSSAISIMGANAEFFGAVGVTSVYDGADATVLHQVGWRLSSTKETCVVCNPQEYDYEECESSHIARYLTGYDPLGNVIGAEHTERYDAIKEALATMSRNLN